MRGTSTDRGDDSDDGFFAIPPRGSDHAGNVSALRFVVEQRGEWFFPVDLFNARHIPWQYQQAQFTRDYAQHICDTQNVWYQDWSPSLMRNGVCQFCGRIYEKDLSVCLSDDCPSHDTKGETSHV